MPVSPRVPSSVTNGAFTVQQALDHGVTARMLQGEQWVSLTRGAYCHASVTVDDEVRLEAVRLVLPHDAVATGKLAAWAHGVWRPPPGRALPLTFARERGRARPREKLDGSRRLVVSSADVVEVNGLPCTSAMRTAFQLLASSRACSPGETRIRMVAVLGGLPEPYVNMPLYRGDELVGLLDLYLVGRRERVVGVEYDGAYHEEAPQRHDDNRRENRISVESCVPVLRYDRYTVARHVERCAALHQMARTIDVEPLSELKAVTFADPRRPFRW